MEHTVAISSILIPILLGLIVAEFGVVAWALRRAIDKNEKDHNELFKRTNEHHTKLAEHEIRLNKTERDIEYLGHRGDA